MNINKTGIYDLSVVCNIIKEAMETPVIQELYSQHTIAKMQETIEYAAAANIFINNLVALLQGLITEEEYHRKLKVELEDLEANLNGDSHEKDSNK